MPSNDENENDVRQLLPNAAVEPLRSVWTLTIDDDDGVSTTVHLTEDDALRELRRVLNDEDANEILDGGQLLEYATTEGGLVLYLDEHDLAGVQTVVQSGVIHTEEGATYRPWTDGYAVGYKVTADDKPDRWIVLNPSQTDTLAESNVFVYLESGEPTPDRPLEQPACYISIWDDPADIGAAVNQALDRLADETRSLKRTEEQS